MPHIRQGMKDKYLNIPLPTTNSGWRAEWFYVNNPGMTAPIWTGHRLDRTNTNWGGEIEPSAEVKDLTAIAIAVDFVHHNIQP